MKKNSRVIILLAAILVLAIAVLATACNPTNNNYTLKFIADGETVSTISASAGAAITPPSAPQKEDFVFKGWYLFEDFSGDVAVPPTFMPAQNLTYYAKYEPATKYTLTFIADGTTIRTITAAEGAAITPPTAPAKDDYDFKGWYLNENFLGNEVTPPTVMPAQNETYYAKYEPKAPVPNDAFDEKNGSGVLEIYGSDVVLQYAGTTVRTRLSSDGSYADFTIANTSGSKTEYCAMLDAKEHTYTVYRYGASSDSYALYLPLDNSFNFEKKLYFEENRRFKVVSTTLEPSLWGSVAEGTYGPAGVSPDEFSLNVSYVGPYFSFEANQIKIKKVLRADEDNPTETLIYNAYMIYDATIAGEYSFYAVADRTSRLSLDGYGYATYTDANGVRTDGMVEHTDVDVFDDTFVTFTGGGESILMLLMDGSMTNLFAIIGDESGIYRVWDVAQSTAGSYYVLLDGFGGFTLWYGVSIEYRPEIEAAGGSYEILESGEFICTVDSLVDASVLTDAYKESFKFKLTTYGSDLYLTKAFVLFDENLFKEYVNGDGTLSLDGYGNAKYAKNGEIILDGPIQILDDLVLVNDASGNQGLFIVTDAEDAEKRTFRQIGLERGNYFLYSYANGFDLPRIIFLDGEGTAQLFEYDENNNVTELSSGTYAHTATEGIYTVTLNGNTFNAAFRQINFGSVYSPDWRYVYIVYDESTAGILTNGAEKLVLDGYGLSAVYTASDGKVYEGNYAMEWNVITFLGYENGDEEYNEHYFTFTVNGNTFAIANKGAGVYYEFSLANNLAITNRKLILDGNGNARLSDFDGESYDFTDGTYTYNPATDEYTVSITGQGQRNIKLGARNGYSCFVIYDESWSGSFDGNGSNTLVLDGYGNAEYDGETVNCLLMGGNLDIVTFTIDGDVFTFILNRDTMKFTTTDEPYGYYHPYADGVISGYVRLFLGVNGTAELYEYDRHEGIFVLTASGTYEALDNGIYSFTPADGEAWTFKLSEINGNKIYSLYVGKTGEYTRTVTVNNTRYEFKLVLDGYGYAEYTSYDTDGDKHTYTGYYTVASYETVTFFAVNYDYGYVYLTVVFELDGDTFTVLSET